MLDKLRRFVDSQLERIEGASEENREKGYQLAAAVLLIEMTRADFEVRGEEVEAVARAVREGFDLSGQETGELMRLAETEVDHATCLHEFTTALNAALGAEQRRHLIEMLWKVAYADGRLDKYEDHFVRRVADLLYVRHSEFMKAKHQVRQTLAGRR